MSHPTLVPAPSSQASSLLKSRVSLEWSFAIRAWVQGEAGLYPEVNHLSGKGHVSPFLFLRLCDWKVLKILGHCLADLSWNGAYAGATVHRYFGLLRRKKHLLWELQILGVEKKVSFALQQDLLLLFTSQKVCLAQSCYCNAQPKISYGRTVTTVGYFEQQQFSVRPLWIGVNFHFFSGAPNDCFL